MSNLIYEVSSNQFDFLKSDHTLKSTKSYGGFWDHQMNEYTKLFHLKLKALPDDQETGYIFTHFDENVSMTAFVRENSVVYGIPKRDKLGIPQGNELDGFITTSIPFNEPIVLSFLYSGDKMKVKLAICLGAEKVQEKEFESSSLDYKMVHILECVGSDFSRKIFGHFGVYEMVSYAKWLKDEEFLKLIKYFEQSGIGNYVDFSGGHFLVKNVIEGGLFQPNEKYQPKYMVEQ